MPGAKDKVVEGLSIFQMRPLRNVNVKSSLGHKSCKGCGNMDKSVQRGFIVYTGPKLHMSKA